LCAAGRFRQDVGFLATVRKEPHGPENLLVALSAHGSPGGSNRTPEDGFDFDLVDPEHLAG
jgi:hypothetical protein